MISLERLERYRAHLEAQLKVCSEAELAHLEEQLTKVESAISAQQPKQAEETAEKNPPPRKKATPKRVGR